MNTTFSWVNTVALATCVGLGLCAADIKPAHAQKKLEPLSVRTSWIADGWDLGHFIAKDKGWYEKRGLDVSIDDGTGSVVTVQMVGSGRYDVGIASLTVMALGREKGLNVKSVAGIIRNGDLGALVSASSPIKTPKDLEGKQCLFTAGSAEAPFLASFFKLGQTGIEKVKMVAVDAATKINMYAAGQGDCMFTTAPSVLPKISKERPSRILLFSDVGLQLPSLGLVVTEQTLNNRREAIKAFVEETMRGWKYVIDGHWDEGVEAVVRLRPNLKINKESVRAVAQAYGPFFTTNHTKDRPLGWQSEEDWKATLAALASVGLIKEGAKTSSYYTNEFIPSK